MDQVVLYDQALNQFYVQRSQCFLMKHPKTQNYQKGWVNRGWKQEAVFRIFFRGGDFQKFLIKTNHF